MARTFKTKNSPGSLCFSQGIGTHYAHLWVGTPPQRFSVIADTGSLRKAFPCDPCRACGDYLDYHESGSFDPAASSTAQYTGERWSQMYSEGDGWEAVVVEDEVFVGGSNLEEDSPGAERFKVTMEIGCQARTLKKKKTGTTPAP